MRVALLLLLTLAAATIGCRKTVTYTSTVATTPDTLIAGTVISSPGTWSASTPKGSQKLEVTISGTSISWSVSTEEKHPGGGGSTGGSSSSGMTLSSPIDPWFIFVESPKRLWFCNGKDQLSYSLVDNGSRSGPAIFSGQLQPTAEVIPKDLIPHLPPDLQKLFPPVVAPEKRPSF